MEIIFIFLLSQIIHAQMYISIEKDKIIIIIMEIKNIYYFYINVYTVLCVNNKVSHKILWLVR